jgi:hypothetical protein
MLFLHANLIVGATYYATDIVGRSTSEPHLLWENPLLLQVYLCYYGKSSSIPQFCCESLPFLLLIKENLCLFCCYYRKFSVFLLLLRVYLCLVRCYYGKISNYYTVTAQSLWLFHCYYRKIFPIPLLIWEISVYFAAAAGLPVSSMLLL